MSGPWVNDNVLDSGLTYIKTNCDRMILVKAYTSADTFATLISNGVASTAMTSADFAIAANSPTGRKITSTAKTAVTAYGNSGATPDLVVGFANSSGSAILWVSDETTNQQIYAANTVNFPAFVLAMPQPV